MGGLWVSQRDGGPLVNQRHPAGQPVKDPSQGQAWVQCTLVSKPWGVAEPEGGLSGGLTSISVLSSCIESLRREGVNHREDRQRTWGASSNAIAERNDAGWTSALRIDNVRW